MRALSLGRGSQEVAWSGSWVPKEQGCRTEPVCSVPLPSWWAFWWSAWGPSSFPQALHSAVRGNWSWPICFCLWGLWSFWVEFSGAPTAKPVKTKGCLAVCSDSTLLRGPCPWPQWTGMCWEARALGRAEMGLSSGKGKWFLIPLWGNLLSHGVRVCNWSYIVRELLWD